MRKKRYIFLLSVCLFVFNSCGLDVVMYAGQGALLGVIAIALYDMVHGAIKEWKSRQNAKEEKKNG